MEIPVKRMKDAMRLTEMLKELIDERQIETETALVKLLHKRNVLLLELLAVVKQSEDYDRQISNVYTLLTIKATNAEEEKGSIEELISLTVLTPPPPKSPKSASLTKSKVSPSRWLTISIPVTPAPSVRRPSFTRRTAACTHPATWPT